MMESRDRKMARSSTVPKICSEFAGKESKEKENVVNGKRIFIPRITQ